MFYLIIKIINKRLLLSNNLIIRDLFKFFFIIIIKINKRYRLINFFINNRLFFKIHEIKTFLYKINIININYLFFNKII